MAKLTKKQIKKRNFINWIIFISFTAILFINNLQQLLSNWFDLTIVQVNTIAWVGLIGGVIYFMWRKSSGEI